MTIKIIRKTATPPLPCFGTISKGDEIPTKDGKSTRPVNLPHFRFSYTEGYEGLAGYVENIIGSQPRAIDVTLIPVFPHDDMLEKFFPHSLQAWNKTRLQVECDGEHTARHWDEQMQAYDRTPTICQMKEYGTCPLGCKWTGRLMVIIPQLTPIAGLGYFKFSTHGKRDITQIVGALEFALSHNLPLGNIMWSLQKETVAIQYKDNNGKMQKRDDYPVKLVIVGVGGGLFGNTPVIEAPTPAPMLVDGTVQNSTQSQVIDEVIYEDDLFADDAPPLTDLQKGVLHLVKEAGQRGVTIPHVLRILDFETWDDLTRGFSDKYPDYSRNSGGIAQAFLAKTSLEF